jgi:hypothetical protein
MAEEQVTLAGTARPIGQSIIELLRMPIEIINDAVPELQKQVQELPDIIRANADFARKSFSQIPETIRSGLSQETRNVPLTLTQAISPFPIMSPSQLAEQAKKDVERLSQLKLPNISDLSANLKPPNPPNFNVKAPESPTVQATVPAEIASNTKKIAEQILKK